MNERIARLDALARHAAESGGAALYACVRTLDIRHVPFEAPCLILVLAGRKILYTPDGPVAAAAGEWLAVSGPAGLDLRNEPDARLGAYRALVLPFTHDHLDRLRQWHGFATPAVSAPAVLHYGIEAARLDAIHHYLAAPAYPRLLAHRLLGLLLLLAEHDPRLLAFRGTPPEWRRQVMAVLAADLTREWTLAEVCQHLAVGESTLRRHLAAEETGFRELLREARLGAALHRLQQSRHPVQRIALDCGYRSVSRFTANFRARFGLTPTGLRAAMAENGH